VLRFAELDGMKRANLNLPKGVSLFELLLRELPPADAQHARKDGYDALVWVLPRQERDEHPETILIRKLSAGELVGTGIFLPIDPHRPRKIIPHELWDNVFINFDKSELIWGENRRIIKVEVLSEEESLKRRRGQTADQESKRGAIRERYVPELTEDGVLTVKTERFRFPGPKQKRLIELLIQCSEKGGSRVKPLLERAGFAPSIETLDRAFQGNHSWPLLKTYLRRRQGFVMFEWDNPQ
jgi:hypothetical protein